MAPMAGLVVKVLVENEAKVDQGQPVLVLEAMKMEVSIQISSYTRSTINIRNSKVIIVLFFFSMVVQHVVKAPSSGSIQDLKVKAGQQVSDGGALFRIKG